MMVRSKITGNVIELSDEGARQLIEAGIYVSAEKEKEKKEPKKTDKSTKVEPLTTEDMPVPTKQVT